jgi:hypothetical protein
MNISYCIYRYILVCIYAQCLVAVAMPASDGIHVKVIELNECEIKKPVLSCCSYDVHTCLTNVYIHMVRTVCCQLLRKIIHIGIKDSRCDVLEQKLTAIAVIHLYMYMTTQA